eukprot:3246291-Lingulodinium_polyedra.AAC.1
MGGFHGPGLPPVAAREAAYVAEAAVAATRPGGAGAVPQVGPRRPRAAEQPRGHAGLGAQHRAWLAQ